MTSTHRRSIERFLALVTAVWLLLAPRAAWTQTPPPDAQRRFDNGVRLYNLQLYGEAIVEFMEAYKLDPRPEILYSLGQSQRLSGDCARAIRSYEAFLRTRPEERNAARARQNIERCTAELAKQAPTPTSAPTSAPVSVPAPVPAPVSAAAPVSSPPPLPPSAPSPPDVGPWYHDRVAGWLTGSGLVTLTVGTVLYVLARNDLAAPDDAATYGDFAAADASVGSAELRQTLGVVGMVAGGALMTAGVVRYATRPRRSSSTLTGGASAQGGFVTWRVQF